MMKSNIAPTFSKQGYNESFANLLSVQESMPQIENGRELPGIMFKTYMIYYLLWPFDTASNTAFLSLAKYSLSSFCLLGGITSYLLVAPPLLIT